MKQTLKLALLCTVTVFAMHAKKDKDAVLSILNQKVAKIVATQNATTPLIASTNDEVFNGRRMTLNDGDLRLSQPLDSEFVLDPTQRALAQKQYPDILVRGETDSFYLSVISNPDPYSRRITEAFWKGVDNFVTIPGEQANSISGYQVPNGPIPWDVDELRLKANATTGKYLAAYYDERDSASGRGDTMWENIKALRSYRFLPKYVSSYAPNGTVRPYNGETEGSLGTPAFVLTHTLTFSSGAYLPGNMPLGVTKLVSPTMIYVTPMAIQRGYLADELTGMQGATDSNVVWAQSAVGSRSYEEVIAAKNNNVYYFTGSGQSPTGPAPFSMAQLYLTSDDDINMSFISRVKLAGYKVLFLTIDAGAGHVTDRMQDLASNPTAISLLMLANFAPDPVFNYKLYLKSNAVATTDPTVLAYTASKTGQSIAALQNLYNQNLAMNFFTAVIPSGVRFDNVVTDTSSPLYPFSVQNIANKTHSAAAISDAWPTATGIQIPLMVKGCTDTRDALLIQQAGADGIVVSNHGGRFYDLSVSTLDALIAILPAVKAVDSNFAVWFDSGIRRGEDILVAYALGAEFVGIGRPAIYANIVNGRQGTRQVLTQFVGIARRAAQIVGLPDLESSTFANLKAASISIVKSSPSVNHNLWS